MIIRMTAGKTRPSRLTYELNKKPVDITDYSFKLVIGYAAPLVVNCAIVSAAAGQFEVLWAGVTLTPGTVPFQIEATDPNGGLEIHDVGTLEIGSRLYHPPA